MKVPSEDDRSHILTVLTKEMIIEHTDTLIQEMASLTPGYVPADLTTLCKEASIHAISRILDTYAIPSHSETT